MSHHTLIKIIFYSQIGKKIQIVFMNLGKTCFCVKDVGGGVVYKNGKKIFKLIFFPNLQFQIF